MRSTRIAAISSAALVALLTLTACSSGSAGGSTAGGVALPRVSTLVSYPPLPSGLDRGLFDDAFGGDASGMKVDYVASGTDGVQALASGHTDIVVGGYDPAALANAKNVRILGISETSPETHALLVGDNSNISSLKDLKGRKIGGYSAGLSPFLALMLKNADLPSDYFDYVQVPNDGGMAALTSGAIDAWYTWDPFYAQAEIQHLAHPLVDGKDFYLNPIVIMTSQTYLDQHERSVDAFLTGYIASTDWVNKHKAQAGTYLASATGMTEDAAAATIKRRDYDVVEPSKDAIAWMNEASDAQRDLGMITTTPNLRTMIDTRPLAKVLSK